MRSRLRSLGRGCSGAGDDLRARVHFSAESGRIWLHEYRMLLVHVEALASLRKELIDALGMVRAQSLFMRMGYSAGVRDAELVHTRAENASDEEAFQRFSMRGTRIQVFPLTPGPRLTESDLQQFAGIVA